MNIQQFYFHKTEKKNTKTYIWENNITTFEQLLRKKWKKNIIYLTKRYQFLNICNYSYITLYITSKFPNTQVNSV